MDTKHLANLCKRVRYEILMSTTNARSGHPTSCLSSVELITTLFFADHFQADLQDIDNLTNDRFILSKGHVAPLLYAIYSVAGAISSGWINRLRKFNSPFEGHPNPRFTYADVATGSLGQGLSSGVGMALGLRLKTNMNKFSYKREPKIYVLLGDSEMAEGQVWEAMMIASHYRLSNLVGIIDVNRLGQTTETDSGWTIETYEKKIQSFGWKTYVLKNGHNLADINQVFKEINQPLTVKHSQPTMIIAKTIKGKGISFLEDKADWHGKALPKDDLKKALKELGVIDKKIKGKIKKPQYNYDKKLGQVLQQLASAIVVNKKDVLTQSISTRQAYGQALKIIGQDRQVVVLDAEVGNSTYQDYFKQLYPDRFFQMFIAEENMMSVAVGLSRLGYIPFVSTFAAFITQTFDQVRMAQYSRANIKIIGSHCGVSIGADGPSQMGLEDMAMMRSILDSIVLYPSDGVSTKKLVSKILEHHGISYLRTTREATPTIYSDNEEFVIGGCKVHKTKNTTANNKKIKVLIITAGITLHEALKAQQQLVDKDIVVIDCYSIKPLDEKTLTQYITQNKNIIVVEDHYPCGGLGEAISTLMVKNRLIIDSYCHLCVKKISSSGQPAELLAFEEIDAQAIIRAIRDL